MIRFASIAALLLLSGCDLETVRAAGGALGTLSAGVTLPPLPQECREDTPIPVVVKGQSPVIALRHAEDAIDDANELRALCEKNYDDVSDQLAGKKPATAPAPVIVPK